MRLAQITVIISFCLFVIFLSLIFHSLEILIECESSEEEWRGIKPEKLLVIGALSAPENRVFREKIRNTWGRLVNSTMMDLKFIIGKRCNIPPEYRIVSQECTPWKIHPAEVVSEDIDTFKIKHSLGGAYTGFRFLVKHNVTVKRIGILSRTLAENQDTQRVMLSESGSGLKITSVSFPPDPNAIGITWKNIGDLKLSPGFEGEVSLVEYSGQRLVPFCREGIKWKPGAIHILATSRKRKLVEYLENSCSIVGITYSIDGVEHLRAFAINKTEREEEWLEETERLEESIRAEDEEYGDILPLEVTDTYRNLPHKVMGFFDWALKLKRWAYVVKTDDDVFLDVRAIEEELAATTGEWDIWSCFRLNWTVPRSGKWRDFTYHKDTYPTFPTGSGYVLPLRALTRVSIRFTGAGEDVNVGASLIGAKHHGGRACIWACDQGCAPRSCNLVQLTPQQFDPVWSIYNQCGNMCACKS